MEVADENLMIMLETKDMKDLPWRRRQDGRNKSDKTAADENVAETNTLHGTATHSDVASDIAEMKLAIKSMRAHTALCARASHPSQPEECRRYLLSHQTESQPSQPSQPEEKKAAAAEEEKKAAASGGGASTVEADSGLTSFCARASFETEPQPTQQSQPSLDQEKKAAAAAEEKKAAASGGGASTVQADSKMGFEVASEGYRAAMVYYSTHSVGGHSS